MPTLLYVGMTFILLNIMSALYIKYDNDYKEQKIKFEKEESLDKINKLEENILSFYNNNYGNIHENYYPSKIIDELSNINGSLNEFYFFNNEKICKYTDINLDVNGERLTTPIKLVTNDNLKQFDKNKNIDCNIDYDSFVSSFSLENKNTLNELKKVVGSNYFLRIDIESIKEFKTISLPILNLYLYESNKQFKPNLFTEKRLNTDVIVSKKIDESKLILDEISNNISEYGKRRFKGFTKLKTYSNINAFSNLAEGYMFSKSDGNLYYGMVSLNSSSGFQSSNLMAFHTRYLNSNTIYKIDELISKKWDKFITNCGFVNSVFESDPSLNWYSENSYYSCKVIPNTTLSLVDSTKPEGYCSLEDMCTLIYTFDGYGKIDSIESLTLYDFIKSDIGLNLDMSKYKNPFFPNESILENDNFVLSSSNGNKGVDTGVAINFGLKIINRDSNISNNQLFNSQDLEKNYLINKYFINY